MIKVVKTISAVLGVLIMVGIGSLGYAFYTSGENPQDIDNDEPGESFAPQPNIVASDTVTMPTDLGTIPLMQPKGSHIESVRPQGSWLYVTVTGGGQPQRILIVDLQQKQVIGHLVLGTVKTPTGAALSK